MRVGEKVTDMHIFKMVGKKLEDRFLEEMEIRAVISYIYIYRYFVPSA